MLEGYGIQYIPGISYALRGLEFKALRFGFGCMIV